MKLIDSHMHVDLAGFDVKMIIESMDRNGVEISWLLTWEELDPPIQGLHMDLLPEPVLEAFTRHPGRFIPFYAPDPATDKLEERIIKYKDQGIRGCGELKVSRKWEDPLIESYLQIVQQHHSVVVFHMENPRQQYLPENDGYFQWLMERLLNDKYNGVSRYYISNFAERTGILRKKIRKNRVPFPGILFDFAFLEKRIRQFPGIQFIGHGPDFWNNISAFQHPKYIHQKGQIQEFGIIDRLLEEYSNFYCDISGTSGFNALNRDHKQSKVFLQKHAHKILYGTDNTRFPLQELLQSMKLEKKQMEKIHHKNARNLLE
ncbi:MAG: hypothetical protein KAR19_14210 [Bacteroidales bacterium]|nr:hypothetical protein [Bacteroidales bacterium]